MPALSTPLSRLLLPILLIGCLVGPAPAQQRQRLPCGTPDLTTGQTQALAKYIKQAEANGQQLRKAAGNITYFGIKPWVVTSSSYWQSSYIVDYINKLNEDFAATHLQFFIVSGGIGTITATISQTLTYPANEASLMSQNFDATAINVYFGDKVYSCGTTCKEIGGICPGLTDAISGSDRTTDIANPNLRAKKDDYILVSQYSSLNTLSHEMGHYFGLLHTFQGSTATTCDDRERPIGTRSAGDSDRGDLIDDTDADPYPLYTTPPFNETTCAYTGNLLHCNTNWPVRTFTPPVNNIMSYWSGGGTCSDRQQFTSHQINRTFILLSARFSPNNQYNLANGVQGISTAPAVSLSVTGTNRLIQITALPGAMGYILETANDVDFTNPIIIGSTSVTATVSFADNEVPPAGTIYYYRVRATNSKTYSRILSYPCNVPTATLTGSQTVTNGQSATFTVALTGNPPWNVQVGGSTYANVTSSLLSIVTPPYPALQQTYTQTTSGGSVTNVCGTAPMSGTASVTVVGTCPLITANVTYSDIGCGRTTGQGVVQITGGATPYAIKWRNVTTGVDYTQAYTTAFNLTLGNYTVDVTDANGCRATQQTFTVRDNGPNGATAVLSGPANNRIVKGQQTAIRVELTGTAPWSVTYTGRGNKQFAERNITTSSYDIAVLPDSTTTYRLVAISGQCSASAVSGSATLIVVPALAALEYFVDTDPGVGQATPLSVAPNQTTTSQTVGIPLQNRPAGVHTLGFRGKDGNGYWSTTVLKPFVVFGTGGNVAPSITQAEYYIDTDPGVGAATQIAYNPTPGTPFSLSINAASLLPGVHTLLVRAKDSGNRWSVSYVKSFLVAPLQGNISRIEYFYDTTDPGLGSASSLAFSPPNSGTVTAQQGVSVSSLNNGAHTITARAKTTQGVWSTSKAASFTVTSCFQALAQLIGSYTATTGQPVSVSVGFGGSSPWSLTANGQVFTDITTPSVSFTVQYANSGSYSVNAQTVGISVANAFGSGVVSGTATVAVTGSCATMYTLKTGAWNDTSVWSCGRVPTPFDEVEVRHGVQIPAGFVASAKKLTYGIGSGLTFGLNARLKLNQ